MQLFARITSLVVFAFGISSIAQEGQLYNGTTLEKVNYETMLKDIPQGSVVFIGEQHGFTAIQKGQLDILNALRANGHKLVVAMEFIDYTQQKPLDDYRSGVLPEADFLQQIGWGSIKFDYYRDQIMFPKAELGEKTFGINSPKWVPSEIAKKGLANTSPEALKMLPPNFQLGRESYKTRFTDMMKDHVKSPEAMDRYFEAQSVWDDTMAWQISTMAVDPTVTIVVIVGQFHVEYGGGLPYRFRVRDHNRPAVVIDEMVYYDNEEIPFETLKPSPEYGRIADYLLILNEKSFDLTSVKSENTAYSSDDFKLPEVFKTPASFKTRDGSLCKHQNEQFCLDNNDLE